MTEQELRAAVAEYDPSLAESAIMDNGWLTFYRSEPYTFWETNGFEVLRESKIKRMECDVIGSVAETMRAMDAAEKALMEALK